MISSRRLLFFTLYLIYFLDVGGIGVVLVLFAPLIVNDPHLFGLSHFNLEQRNVILGFLYAAYPLFQFFGAPILGEISDRFGRKKPLLFSTVVVGIAFFLSALAIAEGSLTWLFISRFIAGIASGNVTIALASVADFVPKEKRASYMGTFNMIGGISWIIAPFLGSFLSDAKIFSLFTPSTPFWVMGFFFCLGGVLVTLFYPNMPQKIQSNSFQVSKIFTDLFRVFRIPKISSALAISILSIFAWFNYQGFMAPYLAEKYHFSGLWIGGTFAYFSFWWFVGGLLANRIFRKGHSPIKINSYPMFLAPLAILSFAFILNTNWIWVATLIANISESLAVSCFFAIFSTMAANRVQGKIFGCWNAGFALSAAVAPILSGWLSYLSINAPFTFASVAHFIAFFLYFVWKRRFAA